MSLNSQIIQVASLYKIIILLLYLISTSGMSVSLESLGLSRLNYHESGIEVKELDLPPSIYSLKKSIDQRNNNKGDGHNADDLVAILCLLKECLT